jgi:hypothetical protein
VTSLRPLARAFLRRGRPVHLIARHLAAAAAFRDEAAAGGVTLWQAPFRHGAALQYDPTPTFAYILHNVGFSDPHELAALVAGWRSLLAATGAALVAADHAPAALLAARTLGLPAVVWGPGFYLPPDACPLPDLLPARPADPAQARAVEALVLANANRVLESFGAAPLGRLADLYHAGPRKFLLTFPELDHYPGRIGETCRGYPPDDGGDPPGWPAGDGPRLFGYLKRFPRLGEVLAEVASLGLPTLLRIDGLDPALRKRFESPRLRFADRMTDLAAAAQGAAAGLTHGGIGATTALLRGGLPLLCLPLHLEQWLVGEAVARLGAGLVSAPEARLAPADGLRRLLAEGRFRAAARAFAEKHRGFDFDRGLAELLAECDAAIGERA